MRTASSGDAYIDIPAAIAVANTVLSTIDAINGMSKSGNEGFNKAIEYNTYAEAKIANPKCKEVIDR